MNSLVPYRIVPYSYKFHETYNLNKSHDIIRLTLAIM